jgi:polyisoprenoid-binding protein YceI
MVVFRILSVAAALLVASTADAQIQCWAGDGESGELRFAGAVEGQNFFGQFERFSVEVCRPEGEGWTSSEWTVNVETASADTRNRDRDETLHGSDFFAVESFPTARWQSLQVIERESGFVVEGELELRGFKAPQDVVIEVSPGADELEVSGTAEILRLVYGIGQGEYEDPDFIRNRVYLDFALRLQPQ